MAGGMTSQRGAPLRDVVQARYQAGREGVACRPVVVVTADHPRLMCCDPGGVLKEQQDTGIPASRLGVEEGNVLDLASGDLLGVGVQRSAT